MDKIIHRERDYIYKIVDGDPNSNTLADHRKDLRYTHKDNIDRPSTWSTLASVYVSPTNNCQLSTIASADVLFSLNRKDTLHLLKELQKIVRKNIMLFDINRSYKEYLKAVFNGEDDIIVESDYTSTNGSKMCIILVRTNTLIFKV